MKNIFKILLLVIVVCLGAVVFSACTGCKENRAYSLIYTAGEGGSIEGDVCQTVHNGESGTEVVAVAGDGFEFVQWSDGVTTQSRTDKNISHDINVTARFAKVEYFTITYDAGEGGSIEGLTQQTVKSGESGQEVTAVPNEGYRFVKWSDGNSSYIRYDENITSSINVIAEFEFLYGGGNGTAINPFVIASYEHLLNMAFYPDAYYKLVNDLDLSDFSHDPLFDEDNPFKGNFNGGDHIIKNLTIETESNVPSLFGFVDGSIGYLNFTNVQINTINFNTIQANQKYYVGIVAGISRGYIHDVRAIGRININELSYEGVSIGGLIGLAYGTIANCETEIKITVKNTQLNHDSYMTLPFVFGGMIGVCDSAHIRNCNSEGDIIVANSSVDICVGGLIGYYFTDRQVSTDIKDSVSNISILGDYHYSSGGFIGQLDIDSATELAINECSSHGNIQMGTVGGFICRSFVMGKLSVQNCFFEGDLTAYSRAAGFIVKCSVDNGNCELKNNYSAANIKTNRFDDVERIVGAAAGFGYELIGVNIKNCFATMDVYTAQGVGFAFFLFGCSLSSCFFEGKINIQDASGSTLAVGFVYGLSNSEIKNCFVNADIITASENGTNMINGFIRNISNSIVANFYCVGSCAGKLINKNNNVEAIKNGHVLKNFAGGNEFAEDDEITVYDKKEDMYQLANILNDGLEEVWVNVENNLPRLNFIVTRHSYFKNINKEKFL